MSTASFTCVIVTYNSANDILDLLADLHTYAPLHKVIVIDNASKDGTVTLVQKHYPQVQLICNSANLGYARAVNQGVALSDTEYISLLNPDIRITTPNLFSIMEDSMKRSRRIAVVAPLQFKDDGSKRRLNFTWSYYSAKAFHVYLSFFMRGSSAVGDPLQVTFLNAGCLFMRRSAFNQVGKLNEKYFLYGEEPDLFLKFKRYGFQCYLLPNVDVTHYREHSIKSVPMLQRLRFKLQAIRNITDALIHGWIYILLDKLVITRQRSVKGE